MYKEIILYNLAPDTTDEMYAEYVKNKKGPFFESLNGVEKFTLVKITDSKKGEIPYRYIGIVYVSDIDQFRASQGSKEFGEFFKEWSQKVSDFHVLSGEVIF